MKKQRIEILQRVADGELTPEQADEQLLGLSIVSGALPDELTWGELKEELDHRFKSFISLGKKFGEYFESDIDQAKRAYFNDWMNDLEEQQYWLERQ